MTPRAPTLQNHEASGGLTYFHHTFMRKHPAHGTTPAVALGVAKREWDMPDLVDLVGW